MKRLSILVLTCFLVVSGTAVAQEIQTGSEQNNFQRYTTYPEMMDYLQKIKATSTDMKLGIYGKSIEGRELPYALFSRPSISQPWEAIALGKPIIVLAANVHGGERTLRESNMLLIRELATKGTEANNLLDFLVIVMVPSINVDGFAATQQGTRGNSQGVDMNRDYMKLEQAALVNYMQNVIQKWHPHLFIDGHNGGSFPYNITYLASSNAAPDQRLTQLADKEIFPFIDKKVNEGGYRSFYYSRVNNDNDMLWNTGGSDPRIGRNYGGFANSVAILFESPVNTFNGRPGTQTLSDGAKSGFIAYKAVLQWSANNADKLISYVNRAREETIRMGDSQTEDIPVQMEYASDGKVDYEYDTVQRFRPENRDKPPVMKKITGGDIMKKPVVLKSRPRPYAYILEPKAHKAAAMLKRHGIAVEILQEATAIEVQAYKLDSLSRAHVYDHVAAVERVHVADELVTQTRTFPKGTYIVKTGQTMGRVVAHLLEPETNDNVVTWNTIDAILPDVSERALERRRRFNMGPPLIPIFKLMSPIPLSSRLENDVNK